MSHIIANMLQTGVHLAAELRDMTEDTDSSGDSTAGVEHIVLTSNIKSCHMLDKQTSQ